MSIYPGISTRPIQDRDLDFLCTLYGTVRMEELKVVPWTLEEKLTFIKVQFDAQHAYYTNTDNYPNPQFDLILLKGQPIGRIYIQRWSKEFRLMDIALMPEYRGRGIGTAFMQQLVDEADQKHIKVSLYVESFNPAYRLYERFGFVPNGTNGVYTFMERFPPNKPD